MKGVRTSEAGEPETAGRSKKRQERADDPANKRLRGQAVKTSPFHGGNTGSIPVGVIYLMVNIVVDFISAAKKYISCRCGSIGRAADL